MFAESGVANERVTTPFKKKQFVFLPFLPRWVNEEYRANARSDSVTRTQILRALVSRFPVRKGRSGFSADSTRNININISNNFYNILTFRFLHFGLKMV